MLYKKFSFKDIAMAICMSLAFTINMSIPDFSDTYKNSGISKVVGNLIYSISGKYLALLLLFIFFLILLNSKPNSLKINSWWFCLINFLIAFIWLLAEGFKRDNSIQTIYASMGQVVKVLIYVSGVFFLLNTVMLYLYSALSGKEIRENENRVFEFAEKCPVRFHFGVIMFFWIPHLILAYPANLCRDAYFQLAQYFGLTGWTSHHPPISTFIMGTIVKLGSMIDGNLGLFLYILLQAVIFALVISYTFKLMIELRTPRWFRVIVFASVLSVPYYTSYIGVFLKDNLYSYMIVILVTELIYMLLLKKDYFFNRKHRFLWIVSVMGVLFLRNNGKYVVYPLYVILFIMGIRDIIKKKKKIRGWKNITRVVITMVLPIVITTAITNVMTTHCHIEKGSIREALSLPLQQTARYVKYYPEDVKQDEEMILRLVIDYGNLAQNYDPRISDPVKKTFKEKPTTSELIDYISVWSKQFLRHPLVYFEATLNQNYYLLYTGVENSKIYSNSPDDATKFKYQIKVRELLHLHSVEPLARMKNQMEKFYQLCFNFPGLNLLSHPASYTLIVIWICCFLIKQRRYKGFIVFCPILLSIVIIILAPVIQDSPRYAFPVIFSCPVAIAYYMYLVRVDIEDE